jgi:flagella synthesis protein FlgN
MTTVTPLNSLREEEHIMSTLLDVLRQEQQLLVTAEIEGLPAVTTRKTALVTQMTLLSAQRHRSLGKCGFRPRKPAWTLDCRQRRRARGVCHAVAALLQHTREAKELNRVNGMLINKQMGHAQRAASAAPERRPSMAQAAFPPRCRAAAASWPADFPRARNPRWDRLRGLTGRQFRAWVGDARENGHRHAAVARTALRRVVGGHRHVGTEAHGRQAFGATPSMNRRTTLLARTADSSQLDGKRVLPIGWLSVCPSTCTLWLSP